MKENKVILENKIREVLPRLKEVGVGFNFIDELGFKAEIVYENVGTYHFFSESDNDIFSVSSNFFGGVCEEVIGHPIKLNDVLEYVKLKVSKVSHHKILGNISLDWDLSSVFLADQSEELIKFLNEL